MTSSSSGGHQDQDAGLALYDRTAQAAAEQVLERYSNSFASGTRLLDHTMRARIKAIYAMVRIADEIVDTYRGDDAGQLLDSFEREVHAAIERGFSPNLVAHAFGRVARETGIGREQTEPFFASMRMDLDTKDHTQASFDRYVFGSAEVIGEMCLAVFLAGGEGAALPADGIHLDAQVREGARRLGAAYQKVNFLRDLATDDGELGRSYFPGITASSLTDEQLCELVADCRADIVAAQSCLPALPKRARIAVATTIDIYSRLLAKVEKTPAAELARTRVRVPDTVKAAYMIRNACPFLGFTRRTA